jgi:hypothetical protein
MMFSDESQHTFRLLGIRTREANQEELADPFLWRHLGQ